MQVWVGGCLWAGRAPFVYMCGGVFIPLGGVQLHSLTPPHRKAKFDQKVRARDLVKVTNLGDFGPFYH